jgi:glucokinase
MPAFLGMVVGDLALTTGARGGVSRGNRAAVARRAEKSEFRARFEAKALPRAISAQSRRT